MCRFLIIKSKNRIKPTKLLKEFALMCEKSLAPDGERQKDGYGVAWIEAGKWELKKSLEPIWEEIDQLKEIPETNLLVAHARGAAFDKTGIEFNQPFIENEVCFVFNGLLKGVSIKTPLEGKNGSQKLFFLLKLEIDQGKVWQEVLKSVRDDLLRSSNSIVGMNVGLISHEQVSILCQYSQDEEYYSLKIFESDEVLLICSEKISNYPWKVMKKGEVKTFLM